MIIDEKIANRIMKTTKRLFEDGHLPSNTELEKQYNTFRNKFGPEKLQNLDGEELLETIHNISNRDSLVYWMEFKKDEEFPNYSGGIGGGSSYKFGLFKSIKTGEWMSGSPQKPITLTVAEAIDIARKNRNQLIKGTELLKNFPENGSKDDYYKLQKDMEKELPDIQNSAWVHKYFSLLFPNKLDDFHSLNFQEFYLLKLLLIPGDGMGRYSFAIYYKKIANDLNLPITILTSTLVVIFGKPCNHWQLIISIKNENKNLLEEMVDGNYITIGWEKLDDFRHYLDSDNQKKATTQSILENYPNLPTNKNQVQEILNFLNKAAINDIVMISDQKKVFAIGNIKDEYSFISNHKHPHQRRIEWLNKETWDLPVLEKEEPGFFLISKNENKLECEKQLAFIDSPQTSINPFIEKIQAILERKKQVILYGPPGTGKTYWAEETAKELSARNQFNKSYSLLTNEEKDLIYGNDYISSVRVCCFHPNYGYEDFIEGYKPEKANDHMVFVLKDGVFKKLCQDARDNSSKNYYLIIDEINRGDIPRIFGELIFLIEKNKREKTVILPLSKKPFSIPDNVYLIGTMNTADRSIALLDTALRRRFGFYELMPNSSILGDITFNGLPLGPWLTLLNQRITENLGHDARNLQIGHSYFLENTKPITDVYKFIRIIREDIIPLLEEYFYENITLIDNILGKGIIDSNKLRIREELFEPSKQDELIQILLALTPELIESKEAIQSEENRLEQNEEENGDINENS
jgi:5-methylcytosine-specific restriction protein B